jgi:hypothetical protein
MPAARGLFAFLRRAILLTKLARPRSMGYQQVRFARGMACGILPSAAITLILVANGGLPVPDAADGVPYELIIAVTNGTGNVTNWAITSSNYGWASITSLSATTALLSGTPGAIGTDPITIQATDSGGNVGTITV